MPPTSQTKAVSAQKPLLPDQPNGQMPTPKQAQLSEDEALGWPRARMGPARSWAEPSPFQMWWGHKPGHGPCGREKRGHGLFVAQEPRAALNPAGRKRNSPAESCTDPGKTPEIHEGPLLGPARIPSKVYLVLQSTQRNPCVPLFQATQSGPTLHGMGSAVQAAHLVSPGGPSLLTPRAPGVGGVSGDCYSLDDRAHTISCWTDVPTII